MTEFWEVTRNSPTFETLIHRFLVQPTSTLSHYILHWHHTIWAIPLHVSRSFHTFSFLFFRLGHGWVDVLSGLHQRPTTWIGVGGCFVLIAEDFYLSYQSLFFTFEALV